VELARLAADSILASAGDAIVAADREGIIRVWNAGAERIFGYGPEEAIGVSLDLIIPEHLRAAHWAGWRAVVSTGRSRVPLKDEGSQLIGMAAVMRDVSKRFEELKALRRELAEATDKARAAGAASRPG
jgi:PAS domain-containing protein